MIRVKFRIVFLSNCFFFSGFFFICEQSPFFFSRNIFFCEKYTPFLKKSIVRRIYIYIFTDDYCEAFSQDGVPVLLYDCCRENKFQEKKMPDVNTLSIELKEEVVLLTFCKNVGWPGVGLYALALAVAGAHLYIAAEYTFYFRNMQVEGAWVFFLLAGFSFLLVLYHLVVWKKTRTGGEAPFGHASCTQR
jgi:hypothetical protein